MKNKISGLLNSNTGGYGARGINVISTTTPANIEISNNFIWNIAATSRCQLTFWPIGIVVDAAISNVNVYYNSVNLYGSLAGYTTATNSAALYVGATVTGQNVRNNILVNTFDNTTVATDKAYAIYSAAANTAYTDINYNDYFVSGTPGVLGYLGADQTTLALWQAATGKDANSVSGDPKFQLATNLHIQPSVVSPVSNAGTPIATVLNDIDGDVRSTGSPNPDIGADEYTFIPTVS